MTDPRHKAGKEAGRFDTGGAMAYPKTFGELKAAGYVFDNDATCNKCGDDIEWYKTPEGNSIPFNSMTSESSPAQPHWQTCSDR